VKITGYSTSALNFNVKRIFALPIYTMGTRGTFLILVEKKHAYDYLA
jgi:hypothetical protein